MGGHRFDLLPLRPLTGVLLCASFGILILSILLPWPGAGQFQVLGPTAPVIAMVGKEAVLSCHLSPSMDAKNMKVKWYRNDRSGLVHQYRTSQDHKEQQMPEYQGRTQFLKENITKGQVALRIHPIRPSDGGEYACVFESSTFYNKAQFKVLVTDKLFRKDFPWRVEYAVILSLLAVGAIIYVLLVYKRKPKDGFDGAKRAQFAKPETSDFNSDGFGAAKGAQLAHRWTSDFASGNNRASNSQPVFSLNLQVCLYLPIQCLKSLFHLVGEIFKNNK